MDKLSTDDFKSSRSKPPYKLKLGERDASGANAMSASSARAGSATTRSAVLDGTAGRRTGVSGAPVRKKSKSTGRSKSRADGKSLGKLRTKLRNQFELTFLNKRIAFDKPMLIIVLLLVVTGLVTMYSASYAYSYYMNDNSTYYISRQFAFACVGIIAMFAVSIIPPEKYKGKVTWIVYFTSIALLVVALFSPMVNGVHRWISLGFMSFQPSEIAKFAVILWCAYYINIKYDKINTVQYKSSAQKIRANNNKAYAFWHSMLQNFLYGVLPFIIMAAPIILLLLKEPHLSCTVLIVLILGTMMYVGGTNGYYFAALVALGAVALYLIIFSGLISYSSTRIEVWLNPFSDRLGAGWQNIQSLYAISSGGLFGVGLGNSRQKYLYISEPQNDFIFAVICEELGLVGALAIVLLFVLFVWRGLALSISHPDRFCKLVGIGITAQIGFQTLLNICVVTNMVPNTGISLPFFSYGGTSLVMLLVEVGILLAISRRSPNKII